MRDFTWESIPDKVLYQEVLRPACRYNYNVMGDWQYVMIAWKRPYAMCVTHLFFPLFSIFQTFFAKTYLTLNYFYSFQRMSRNCQCLNDLLVRTYDLETLTTWVFNIFWFRYAKTNLSVVTVKLYKQNLTHKAERWFLCQCPSCTCRSVLVKIVWQDCFSLEFFIICFTVIRY